VGVTRHALRYGKPRIITILGFLLSPFAPQSGDERICYNIFANLF
jgi:hypothetical protein